MCFEAQTSKKCDELKLKNINANANINANPNANANGLFPTGNR